MRLTPTVLVVVLFALLSACGGSSPTAAPPAVDDGCRPPLTDDDPDPLGSGGTHPDLDDPEWVGALAEELESNYADVSAGVWLDQSAGEVVVMLAGDDRTATLDELRSLVDRPELLVCMEATYTEAELRDLLDTAMSLTSDPASGGVDTIRNRIQISPEVDVEAFRDRLADELDPDALAAVDIEVQACAEVLPPADDDAVLLPGGGSTCGGMAALVTGTLVGDGTCAWIEEDQGTAIAVLWPRGWWLAADGTVHDHRGDALAAIGDRVDAGGGIAPPGDGAFCGAAGDDGVWVLSGLTPVG